MHYLNYKKRLIYEKKKTSNKHKTKIPHIFKRLKQKNNLNPKLFLFTNCENTNNIQYHR